MSQSHALPAVPYQITAAINCDFARIITIIRHSNYNFVFKRFSNSDIYMYHGQSGTRNVHKKLLIKKFRKYSKYGYSRIEISA